MISYYFGGRAYHVPIMPHVHPTSSAVTYSLDEGKTKFFDLLQLVEFYQLNKGTLNSKLTHYIVTNSGMYFDTLTIKIYINLGVVQLLLFSPTFSGPILIQGPTLIRNYRVRAVVT